MVGLLDIAPAVKTITVRGQAVSVPGVSAQGIAILLARFPELRRAFTGNEVKMERLFEIGGDLVAAIIAAGTGTPGDAKAESIAATLSVDEQMDAIRAILEVTMPGGVGPFVAKLEGLGGLLGVQLNPASPGTGQDTSSP